MAQNEYFQMHLESGIYFWSIKLPIFLIVNISEETKLCSSQASGTHLQTENIWISSDEMHLYLVHHIRARARVGKITENHSDIDSIFPLSTGGFVK